MKKPILILILLFPSLGIAKGVYQEPEDFISEAFSGTPPDTSIIWLRDELRQEVSDILQHKPDMLRLRYWYRDNRSVWVIDEIGKEKKITIGVIVNNGKIEKVKTLVFRESRGWEISQNFFTRQFINRTLTAEHQLDQPVDSITGATLSVRAVDKASRIALLLHARIRENNP